MHPSERQIFRFKMIASFIDDFKNYFENNDIEIRTKELISGLDEKSTNTVNTFIERYKLFMKAYDILGDNFFINPKDYLSNEEINQKPFPEKYKGKIAGKRYEDNVFINHCGLKSLNHKIREQIKNKDIIDGGAFVGDSALVFSEYRPKHIYCFEPTIKNQKLLNETIAMNNMDNVSVISMALSDKKGSGTINIAGPGSTLLAKNKTKPTQETNITTIDDFASDNNLNLGLLKLDVEGFEFNVIKGAVETLKKHKPILLISLYHRGEDFFEIKPFIEKLDLGYKFKIVKENNTLFYEILLIAYPDKQSLSAFFDAINTIKN